MAEGRLYIVGTGPGGREWLTPAAAEIIGRCRFVAGARRLLSLAPAGAETLAVASDLEAVADFVERGLARGDVCVLASGDPGCFSILGHLGGRFREQLVVVPGISAAQLLAARLGVPWHGWRLQSLHGRGRAAPVPPRQTTLYFCDGENTPAALACRLLEQGGDCRATAAADLGREGERLVSGSLADVAAADDLPGNSLLLVEPRRRDSSLPADAAAPGIPDHLWQRREGIPLTKSEVRAVLMARARPAGRKVIWDLGTGTGSYGVECALLEPGAQVFAVDKRPEACRLAAENAARFGASLRTLCGEAPGCLGGLPAPDLVIVGGNDGRLEEIFAAAQAALAPGGRLVVTAVLERTRRQARELFDGSGLQARKAVRVAVARDEGDGWREQNPVTIFSGDQPAAGGNEEQ